MIVKKPLAAAPKRLQRLMIRLMQYDVEIKYWRGPEMYFGDTLSRAYLPHHPGKADLEVERIRSVNFVSVSEPQIQEIREETAKDAVLQSLKAVILNGWPNQRESLPTGPRHHFNIRDELAAQDGVIFKGPKCAIPTSLIPKIKEKLHRSHIWYSRMLEKGTRSCVLAQHEQRTGRFYLKVWNLQHLPACSAERAVNLPWHPTTPLGEDWLQHVHTQQPRLPMYSRLLQKQELPEWLEELKKRFATHGIPETFHSDDGPPFNSNEFSAFAAMYEFEHINSSPEYPQSNGKVENAVKTSKNLMKKAATTNSDFQLALPWIPRLKVWRVHLPSGCSEGVPEHCCRLQKNAWNPS